MKINELRQRNTWPTHARGMVAWEQRIMYITDNNTILCPNCANIHINRTKEIDDKQFYIKEAKLIPINDLAECDHCSAMF